MSDHKKYLEKKRIFSIEKIKKNDHKGILKNSSKQKKNSLPRSKLFDTKPNESSLSFKYDSNLDEIQDKSSTENQRHSLIRISKLVYQYLTTVQNTTGNEVTEQIKIALQSKKNDQSNQNNQNKNIQRRVYDAINVMCAVGLIKKYKQNIEFLQKNNKENTNNNNKILNEKTNINIEKKQDKIDYEDKIKEITIELNEKLKILIKKYLTVKFYEKYNKLNYNNPQRKYQKKMEFPFDIIEYDNSSPIKITSKEDLSRYLIVSNSGFVHYSPYDIIKILISPDILSKLNEGNNNSNNNNLNQNKTNSKKSTNDESFIEDLNINLNNNLNNSFNINEEEEKKDEDDPKKIKILNDSYNNLNCEVPYDTKIVINNSNGNNNNPNGNQLLNNNERETTEETIFNYLKTKQIFIDELQIKNELNQFGMNNNINNENNEEEFENNFDTFTEHRIRKNSNESNVSNLYDDNIMKQNKGDCMSEMGLFN
jgi:hypothetical protein